MLAQMEKVSAQTRILGIGCGTGEMAALIVSITNAQVTGSDICTPFTEEAVKRHRLPNLKFLTLDFNHSDVLDDIRFDYIVRNGILHHLYNNLNEVLVHIRKLLANNGKIIFLESISTIPIVFSSSIQRKRCVNGLNSNRTKWRYENGA
jgi:2-polyprenyl-3-methyl-5-hydroxy-6-metoxy-1,4-benzoquinol methylase